MRDERATAIEAAAREVLRIAGVGDRVSADFDYALGDLRAALALESPQPASSLEGSQGYDAGSRAGYRAALESQRPFCPECDLGVNSCTCDFPSRHTETRR